MFFVFCFKCRGLYKTLKKYYKSKGEDFLSKCMEKQSKRNNFVISGLKQRFQYVNINPSKSTNEVGWKKVALDE